MNISITSIAGFVVSHLAEYCPSWQDAKVYGTVLLHRLGNKEEIPVKESNSLRFSDVSVLWREKA